MIQRSFICSVVFAISLPLFAESSQLVDPVNMVYIDSGSYAALFKQDGDINEIEVDAFYLDQYQVTNGQFVQFVEEYPKWHPEGIKPVFADKNYLKHLNLASMDDVAKQPVTNVSWFAAKAYCKALSKRLPTLSEWEYVGRASEYKADGSNDSEYRQQILKWYSRPSITKLPDVEHTEPNYWQVFGMHGVVWELVSDFNTSLVTGESRGDSQLEQQLFCGAGAASSIDPGDYAAFMRYALRSSYEASYTLSSMGFRCARDVKLIAKVVTQ